MSRGSMIVFSFAAVLLFAAFAAAPAGAQQVPVPSVQAAAPVQAGAALDLAALTGKLQGTTCPAAKATSETPDLFAAPGARLGYCHCGCSSVRTCRTSADCGGASCDQVISCC